jgi:prepilin-type N-terminal cleavage/methylation domain-containing protein
MTTKKIRKSNGFTLIEIAIVIGLIAVLAATAIVAINPARQFKLARNSQRISNVNAILNAVGERVSDNHGTFEGAVAGTSQACPSLATGVDYAINKGPTSAPGALDLSCLTPAYIPALPADPKATAPDTGYVLNLDENDRVTVKAPLAELGTTIAAGR